MDSEPRVPIALRSLVAKFATSAYGGPACRRAYETVAARCAQSFSVETDSVFLIRGAVRHCVPGISDLDYLARPPVRSPEEWAYTLRRLRDRYRVLRRRYPLLGGLQVCPEILWRAFEQSRCGANLWYRPARRWEGDRWRDAETPPPAISELGRLGIVLFHFLRAQCFRAPPPLRRAEKIFGDFNREREIAKCERFLDRPTPAAPHAARLLGIAAELDARIRRPGHEGATEKSYPPGAPYPVRVVELADLPTRIGASPSTGRPEVFVTPAMAELRERGWAWENFEGWLKANRRPTESISAALRERARGTIVSATAAFVADDRPKFLSEISTVKKITYFLSEGKFPPRLARETDVARFAGSSTAPGPNGWDEHVFLVAALRMLWAAGERLGDPGAPEFGPTRGPTLPRTP